ncbi:MAG TPA: TetR/AcrR family transcriptional regulator [Magnetospirillaceae bacterium]|nr:TetR/AcrR family transcriptional regulator [Magnetospirillaceae bacterium]
MTETLTQKATGQRGPADHERRQQIIAAADEHFRHYGYGKTTVADLARAIGLSSAYIYKFFESKQAIGQAVVQLILTELTDEVQRIADERTSTSDRLRRIFQTLARRGLELFFNQRRMHDIAVTACAEHWAEIDFYKERIGHILAQVIGEGRDNGDFEKKTPLDETVHAVQHAMVAFLHPMLLEECLDEAEGQSLAIANLVLRSLAP